MGQYDPKTPDALNKPKPKQSETESLKVGGNQQN